MTDTTAHVDNCACELCWSENAGAFDRSRRAKLDVQLIAADTARRLARR